MDIRDRDILLHTLGLSDPYKKESYRNYFVAGEGHDDLPTLLKLCEEGLMEEVRGPGFLNRGDRVFCVTDKGKAVANRERPRPSKAKRRYLRFLDIRDSYPDLTMKQFLTDPSRMGM